MATQHGHWHHVVLLQRGRPVQTCGRGATATIAPPCTLLKIRQYNAVY